MSFSKQLTKTVQHVWARKEADGIDYGQSFRDRMQGYRRAKESVVGVEKPYNIVRARALGYKAKPGFTVARVRIRKGGGMFIRPNRARKPKRMGIRKMTRNTNIQSMAEQRANKHYPNMEVLNSYKVGMDGKNYFYEVILVDPVSPSVMADKDMNWITEPQHKGRVYRGKTSAGRKSRGLHNPAGARGSEKVRPGQKANKNRAK